MLHNSDNIHYLFPATGAAPETLSAAKPDQPFSAGAVDFLSDLSAALMKEPQVRAWPDVATFAFFCRRANLAGLAKQYAGDPLRLGRGLVFHIAPSNVPVNFAYSMVCGILSGNANIVRVPSKDFPQVGLIADAIAKIAPAHPEQAARLALVKYERGSSATGALSALCHARVIWGGDETIANIRQSPLPPRSFDVSFADRYSFAAIDAGAYLTHGNKAQVAEGFYNDTYLFDQNACSAPHLVVWVGTPDESREARDRFWQELHAFASKRYEMADVLAVDKLTAFFRQSLGERIRREPADDNLLWRTTVEELPVGIENFRCAAGYFSEYSAATLDEIAPIITNRYQTIAYLGFGKDELETFITRNRPCGVDRIVPIGKTTDFSLTWDGYNMINTLTRKVTVL